MSNDVKIFNLQGQVVTLASKADDTWKITISTQELTGLQIAYLNDVKKKHIYFFMAEKQFDFSDIASMPPEPKSEPNAEGKQYSKSQLLRFTLMDLFKAEGITDKAELEQKYQAKMEEIINFYEKKKKK